VSSALFELDGNRWCATELSRGPWDPRHCHGGPISALLARAVLAADTDAQMEWQLARMSIELTRPVPVLTPLSIATQVERPGRKVSLVASVLSTVADDVEVARVRALRIRSAELDLPADAHRAVDQPLPAPEVGVSERPMWAVSDDVAFHSHACEHRFVEGSWTDPGPVGVWIRLVHPVVDGEVPSGLERVAAAADFGNGVSASLPYEQFVFINPDLTIHLLRPPVGEWVGMRTASHYGSAGAGMAETQLFDIEGRIGRSCQSLFVDAR
jgi:hypothetical protein